MLLHSPRESTPSDPCSPWNTPHLHSKHREAFPPPLTGGSSDFGARPHALTSLSQDEGVPALSPRWPSPEGLGECLVAPGSLLTQASELREDEWGPGGLGEGPCCFHDLPWGPQHHLVQWPFTKNPKSHQRPENVS